MLSDHFRRSITPMVFALIEIYRTSVDHILYGFDAAHAASKVDCPKDFIAAEKSSDAIDFNCGRRVLDYRKIFIKQARPTSIGGQAVIEGVMMKGPENIAIAVRKPDQQITVKKEALQGINKNNFSRIPIIRGVFALIGSMVLGIKSLTYSAEFFDEASEEKKKVKIELWIEKIFLEKPDDLQIYLSVAPALVFESRCLLFFPRSLPIF